MSTRPVTTVKAPPAVNATVVSRRLREAGFRPVNQTRDGIRVSRGGHNGGATIFVSVADSPRQEARLAADLVEFLDGARWVYRKTIRDGVDHHIYYVEEIR